MKEIQRVSKRERLQRVRETEGNGEGENKSKTSERIPKEGERDSE